MAILKHSIKGKLTYTLCSSCPVQSVWLIQHPAQQTKVTQCACWRTQVGEEGKKEETAFIRHIEFFALPSPF